MVSRIVWLIIGISIFLLVMYVAKNFFSIFSVKNSELKGPKEVVVKEIVNLGKDCFEKNYPRDYGKICDLIRIHTTINIPKEEIEKEARNRGIFYLVASDLNASDEVLIRYENQKVYMRSVKYERISS